MLRTLNSAAMNALAAVKNIFVMFSVIFAIGMVGCLTSCDTGIDDVVVNQTPCETGDCDDPDNPTTDPEAKVESVEKMGCDFGAITWSAENATLTKAASDYTYANRDGGVFGKQTVNYLYSVIYNLTDKNYDSQKAYTLNNAVAAFNYKNTRYLAKGGDAIFNNEPEITKDGNVTVLTWGEKEHIAFLATSIPSVSSLTIEGIEKRDLCNNGVSYTYESFEFFDNGSDDEYYHKTLRVYGIAEVSDAAENATQKFYIDKTYYIAKENGVTPPQPSEKEPIKYDITNKDITNSGVTGDLVVTYDDGSKETLGKINIRLNHSTFNNAEQTIKVNNFDYEKLEASYAENLTTGNVRSDNQLGCQISITEYKNTITMRTNKATCVMGGIWEFPIVIDPLGGEHTWEGLTGWELSENSITDDGGNGNRMVLTYTANADYNGSSETIKSIVNLVKEEGHEGEETKVIDMYVKDARIEGKYIKWTLVKVYNNTNESETPMMIAHLGEISTEERKTTWDRSYATTTPSMVLKSTENFSQDNYSGTLSTYTSTFSYPDFTNVVTSQARNVVYYSEGEFELEVWNENLLVVKSGVDKGVSNISSDSSVKVYLDKINYSLKNGGTECATGVQEVEYHEEVEDSNPGTDPTPGEDDKYSYSVEKDKVEGNKLYYYEITTNETTGETSKVRKSKFLVFSLHATACSDWTVKEGEATGMSLTTTSHSYTGAKDYTFGSNRGNNTAAAELTTEYTVSFQGKDYPLSISGSVSGSVERTSSTSTHNTYTFTASLLADGVTVATDSDQAVETVEKEEEKPEDKVTRSVEPIGVSNGNLNYYYIVKHSVNTELDSKTQHSVPVVASVTATACADWTAKEGETGMSLTTSSHSYSGAQNYTFGSNRGNCTANASLQESYVVTHDGQNFTLTVSGSVTGSVSKSGNTYTFTANVLADGSVVASASDTATETVEPSEPEVNYIKVTSVDCNVGVGSGIGSYFVAFVAHYEDGVSISDGGIKGKGGNTVCGSSLGTVSSSGDLYTWSNGTYVNKQEFTYNGYGSPFIGCASVTQNADGSVTATNNWGQTVTFEARLK